MTELDRLPDDIAAKVRSELAIIERARRQAKRGALLATIRVYADAEIKITVEL